LQTRDGDAFAHQLLRFSALAASFIAVTVYQRYLNQGLQIRWRAWMSRQLLGHWVRPRSSRRPTRARPDP